ncbi:hypothetical protein GpartN1_g7029.t1 [Galdieria partita]|uniref:RFTS domain-containing protein n=1 Tax=Galdieria partita TaxID=83374 RepID=A0A9C7Q2E5_9RHOD|nr:hypothetical protein GpartN1_g7029.t1 [Galdieria partita]
MKPLHHDDMVSNDSDRNQPPLTLDTIQHSWLLPATFKLLLLASQPLQLPPLTPMELESAIQFPQSSILLAEIIAKFLGLQEPRREQLIFQADHTWMPALVKWVHEYRRECFEPLFVDKPQLFWLPCSRRKGRLSSYLFYDWQTWIQLHPLDRLETLYLLIELVLFELDTPLAENIRNMAPEKLRVEPLGFDSQRNCYWYFDDDCRIYMEEPLPFGTIPWNSKEKSNGLSCVESHSYSDGMKTRSSKRKRIEENQQSNEFHSVTVQDENCLLKYNNYVPCFGKDTRTVSQWKIRVEGVSELQEMLFNWKEKRHSLDRQLKKRLSSDLLPRWEAEEERIGKEREKREKKDWILTAKRRSSRVLEKQSIQQEEEKIKEQEREEAEKIQKRRQRLQAERLAVVEVIDREREKEFRDWRESSHSSASQQPNQLGMQWRDIGVRQLRDKKRIPYMKLSDDEYDQQEIDSFTSQFVIFFDELSVLNEYDRLLEDNITKWRLVDRFALYSSKTGQMMAIEDLDRNEEHLFVLEAILIPPQEGNSQWMPAAFRCNNIQDWCIEYGMEPRLWLKSSNGIWYQLKDPYKEYRNVYQTTRRKFELCSRIYILCMTLSPLVCSYSKIVEFLSYAYGEMKPYTEEEIGMEASFILSQLGSLNEGRIVHSGFFRHLQKRHRQQVIESNPHHPSLSWNTSTYSQSTLQWNPSRSDSHGNEQSETLKEENGSSSSSLATFVKDNEEKSY